MPKKTKKNGGKDEKDLKKCVVGEEVKKAEEETEKEGGALSDGVLDAFEEVAPVDPLLEDEEDAPLLSDDEDDQIDSGDYRPSDEW
jgi:hypothetical protein